MNRGITISGTPGSRPDVVVVGGGVVGGWSAYHLASRGCRVTLIERGTIGSGASSGNCGYLCPSHVMPLCGPGAIGHALPQLLSRGGALSIPLRFDPVLWRWLVGFARNCGVTSESRAAAARHELLRASYRLYQDYLADRRVDCRWNDRGLLMVHRDHRTWDGFQAMAERLASEFDVHADRLDAKQLCELDPSLVDSLAGGWHFNGDSHLDPGRLMQNLHSDLKGLGVAILENTEVLSLDVGQGHVRSLKTSSGDIRVDQIVLATGAETPRFAADLKCRIPIVPGKGYSMTFTADRTGHDSDIQGDSDSGVNWPQVPMIFEDTHVAITPLGDELRIGSTMQLMGYDQTIDPKRLKMIRDNAQTYLRDPIQGEPTRTWVGWRPMAVDDLPCIDRAPAVDNAWVASGNGMIGLSTGTATGHLIADLVCGETPLIDASPFSLSRFSSKRLGRGRTNGKGYQRSC